MEENAALSAKSLIEQKNRQYNETNALYHAAAVQFGLSDTAFWILYALYSSAAPLTQVQMCAEWCLPKQTLNSAVRSMVEQGLLVLTPAPGGKRAKNLNLTESGRALAEKTIARVVRAEAAAICRMGLERMETDLAIRQGYLQKLREEFTQLKEKTDGHKTEEPMSKDRIQLSDHFTTGRLLRFVASPIIMMIFTSVYCVVDGFFVSNFAGKTAFSALNLIYPFLQAFGCLGFMVGTGGSALVAMTLGTGDKKQADNLFSMLAASTIVMGIVSTIIGWFLLEPAAQLLGATPELLPNCLMYGRILLVFQTAFMMQFFFQSFFITSEKPKLGLAFTVLAGLTNIVLDFLLVGVLRGGIVGAASATVISQMVGGIGPMFYFFNRKNSSLLHFVRPKFSAKALGKACANGSSELMTNLSASLVSALYNLQLMKLIGADGVAAYGVLMYVGFIFAAVFIGYAQGCAPIISYHYGAENHDELKNLFRKSITMLAIAGVAMFASAQLMATPLAKMFVGYDTGLMELTEHALKLYAFSFLLCGFNIFSSAFFTALNNGAISAAISFLRTLVFQVFAVLVLPMVLDIDGIWYALVFAEAAALLVSAVLLVKNRNRYHYA